MLGGILCGMIADRWQCHRKVIVSVCLISLVAITTKPAVSVYYGNPETNQCPSSIVEVTRYASVEVNTTLKSIACNPNCTRTIVELNYDHGTLYIIMILLNFCFGFCEGTGLVFVDTSTLRRVDLASKDRPIEYGRQRMFSGIGAMFGIFITNLSADFFPESSKITCYAGIFIVYGILTLLFSSFTLLSYRGLTFREANKKEEEGEDEDIGNMDYSERERESRNLLLRAPANEPKDGPAETTIEEGEGVKIKNESKDATKIFFKTIFQFDTVFFLLTTFISGLEYSQFTSFTFVYLKELGAPSILLQLSIMIAGLMVAVSCAYSENIIELLGGKWRSMLFTFFMYSVRYFGISLIKNPWHVLIFQSFHGMTFSVFVAAGLKHLKETSPQSILTSMVSLFNSIHYGMGTFTGSIISGVIYQQYGGRVLYTCTALLSFAWFLVLIVYILFKERREMKKTQEMTSV